MYIQHRRGVRYIDNTGCSYGNKGVHRSSCRGAALAQCATLQGSPTESALRGHRGIGQGHTGIVGCSKVRTGIPQLRRHRVQGPSSSGRGLRRPADSRARAWRQPQAASDNRALALQLAPAVSPPRSTPVAHTRRARALRIDCVPTAASAGRQDREQAAAGLGWQWQERG